MLIAITRAVSQAINRCELGYLERQEISYAKADAQHRLYEACLAELGAKVISLPAEPDYPDSVFVEDPAVVVEELAIITRMGAASRRGEAESIERALERYRPVRHIKEPATLEGGDVMRIGRKLFVGISHRSNREAVEQLWTTLAPLGYMVVPVEVQGALHLKSACCHVGGGVILVNRKWLDPAPLRDFQLMDVAPEEPRAANALLIGETVVMPHCFPRTAAILTRLGRTVRPVDVSELMKAEAGVTCSSLVFEDS